MQLTVKKLNIRSETGLTMTASAARTCAYRPPPIRLAIQPQGIRHTESLHLLGAELGGFQRLVEREIHMDGAGIHPQRRGYGPARERTTGPESVHRGLTRIEVLPDEPTVELGLVDRLIRVCATEFVRPVRGEHEQRNSGL